MPLLPGPDQAGDRVRVLPGLRQVSTLPLSLRGGELHRYREHQLTRVQAQGVCLFYAEDLIQMQILYIGKSEKESAKRTFHKHFYRYTIPLCFIMYNFYWPALI